MEKIPNETRFSVHGHLSKGGRLPQIQGEDCRHASVIMFNNQLKEWAIKRYPYFSVVFIDSSHLRITTDGRTLMSYNVTFKLLSAFCSQPKDGIITAVYSLKYLKCELPTDLNQPMRWTRPLTMLMKQYCIHWRSAHDNGWTTADLEFVANTDDFSSTAPYTIAVDYQFLPASAKGQWINPSKRLLIQSRINSDGWLTIWDFDFSQQSVAVAVSFQHFWIGLPLYCFNNRYDWMK